jgi:hypothetical protein
MNSIIDLIIDLILNNRWSAQLFRRRHRVYGACDLENKMINQSRLLNQ